MRKFSEHNPAVLNKVNELSTKSSFNNLFPADICLEWNTEGRVLSLLSTQEPHILAQQQFTKNEWLLLTNLIQSYPHYAPHEMLLAQLTLLSDEDWRQQLQEIRQSHPDDIVRELKPVYRALSGVRTKLQRLYPRLKISLVRNTGYVFTLAPEINSQTK